MPALKAVKIAAEALPDSNDIQLETRNQWPQMLLKLENRN